MGRVGGSLSLVPEDFSDTWNVYQNSIFWINCPPHPQATLLRTLPVIPQVILPPESLVADVTSVLMASSIVGPLVDEQVVGFGKVSAAKTCRYELFFRFGGQPPSGLSVRSQFTEARDGAPQARAQLAQVCYLGGSSCVAATAKLAKSKQGRSLCRAGGHGQWLPCLGWKRWVVRQSREGETGIYKALRRRHLGDGGAGDFVHVGVPQSQWFMHGLHGAEPYRPCQVVHRGGEGVHGLQEGVVLSCSDRWRRNGRRQGRCSPFSGMLRGGVATPFSRTQKRMGVGLRRKPRQRHTENLKMAGREGKVVTIIQACLVCPLAPRGLPHLPSKTPSPPTPKAPQKER